MRRSPTALAFAVLATAGLLSASVATAAPARAADPPRDRLPASHPRWATPGTRVGQVPADRQVSARVYLSPHDPAGLDSLLAAVSDPGNPQYRHFLSADDYRRRFSPTSSEVDTVARWLRGAGLTVSAPQSNGRYVDVNGSAGAAERAFSVTLALYHRPDGVYQAPSTDISVPADVRPYVLAVGGLDEAPRRAQVGLVRDAPTPASPAPASSDPQSAPAGFRNARPCSQYYGQITARYQADYRTPLPQFNGSYRPYTVCGYAPDQLRAAYGTASLPQTGRGQTVAIIDAYLSPTLASDVATYNHNRGDQQFGRDQLRQVRLGGFRDQQACDAPEWYSEQTLDVDAVHAIAPDASVRYYAARSCDGPDLLDALARVVDDNAADIVSSSWGFPEESASTADIVAFEQIFRQGSAQGMSFVYSTGDSGDEVDNTGLRQPDYPASDPYVTAVGGTSLAVGSDGSYLFEAGWGTDKFTLTGSSWHADGFLYGGGGGYSTLFNRPSWQNGVVPARAPAGRAVPDVSLDGDPNTGMLVGLTQQFPEGVHYDESRTGGTSLAAPLFAGMQALAGERAGGRMGFANPRIYRLASQGIGFRDVTSAHDSDAVVRPDYANRVDPSGGLIYSVRTFDDDASLHTARGWDPVTGVGSPTDHYVTGR